jgi:hypothetical protein
MLEEGHDTFLYVGHCTSVHNIGTSLTVNHNMTSANSFN